MQIWGVPWNDVAQLAISVVAFPFVVYQIWQLNRSVQADTHSNLYDHYLKVIELFFEKPHLRPYFYECKRLTDDANAAGNEKLRREIDVMCETIAGLLEHAAVQKKNLPGDSWENCWKAFTVERFRQSPALRQFLAKNGGWYAEAFRTMLAKAGVVLHDGSAEAHDS